MTNITKIRKDLQLFLKKQKFTLLDYLIIILVISGIAFYFFLFKRETDMIYIDVFSPSPEWTEDSYPVARWQTEGINKGDISYNSFGQTSVEVIEVQKAPWNAGKQEYMFVTLKLKANYDKNTKVYSFNGNPLLLGDEFSLESNAFFLEGRIVNVYRNYNERSENLKHKKAFVTVVYRYQEPSVAEKVSTKSELYDSSGKLLLKIKNIEMSPAEEFNADWQGKVIQSFNPVKKDIFIEVEIPDVECSQYNCFYNHYYPLAIGWDFPIDFGDLTMRGESVITNVEYYE